jgi:DNA-binding NarL/FixJ family response regulator
MIEEIPRPQPLRTLVATARLTDRERIVRALDRAGGYDVLAETGDGRSAVRLSGQIDAELVLVDVDMPELCAIDATPAILHKVPGATIVVLTRPGDDSGGAMAVRFGARSHVPIDSPPEVLLAALAAALSRELAGRQPAPAPAGTPALAWWSEL